MRFRPFIGAALLSAILVGPGSVLAQTTGELLPATRGGKLSITLLGGWGSWAQKAVNDDIRLDNMLLTAPVDSGGIGLEKGLAQLTDGLTPGIEARWRLGGRTALVMGALWLTDRSEVAFEFDSGSGPQPGSFSYRVEALPVWLGVSWVYPLTARATYRVTAAALWTPWSRVRVKGSLGSGTSLDEEGSTSGLGLLFGWGGEYRLSSPLSAHLSARLRLARLGDPESPDGDPVLDFFGDPLTMDWSGVDLLLGLTWDLLP